MKGKWASGIQPRNFTWVLRDRLAVCERPGGYGANHRKVRRKEEIIWLRQQGFDCVVSMLGSPHNLHAYDEEGMPWARVPFGAGDDSATALPELYAELQRRMSEGQRLVVHRDELGDVVSGAMSGYLVYAGTVPEIPRAVAMVEHLVHRQMGPPGRQLVTVAASIVRPRS